MRKNKIRIPRVKLTDEQKELLKENKRLTFNYRREMSETERNILELRIKEINRHLIRAGVVGYNDIKRYWMIDKETDLMVGPFYKIKRGNRWRK
jgi:hypothetical protein